MYACIRSTSLTGKARGAYRHRATPCFTAKSQGRSLDDFSIDTSETAPSTCTTNPTVTTQTPDEAQQASAGAKMGGAATGAGVPPEAQPANTDNRTPMIFLKATLGLSNRIP